MKKNLNIINLTLLITLTLTVSCSKEKIKEPDHRNSIDSNSEQSTFIPSHISASSMSSLKTVDLNGYSDESILKSSYQNLKKMAKELGQYLNQDMIDQFQNTKKLQDVLSSYDLILLQLIKNNQVNTDSEANKILENYFSVLLQDCDEDLKGCINLSFFSKDYYKVSSIIIDKIKSLDLSLSKKDSNSDEFKKELSTYYKFIDLAIDFKNSQDNEVLNAYYIKYAFEYASLLKEKHEAYKKENFLKSFFNRENEKLIEHGSLFENKLKIYMESGNRSKSKDQVLHAIRQFNPCEYSKNNPSAFFKYGEPELLSLSSEFMGKELISCFSNTMKNNYNKEDKLGISFKKTVDTNHREHDDIVNNLGMQNSDSIFNEQPAYLYIIDNLYRGNWSEEDAQSLTDKLNLDNAILLAVVEAYIRHELLNAVIKTNTTMHEIYYNDKTVTSKNIYNKAIEDNLKLITIWKDFDDRKETLKRFSLYNLNKNRKPVIVTKFNTLFQNLDKNIKYIASVPQMLLLTYKMAQKEFKISVMGFFGAIEIDTNDIINKFFSGDFPLWFKFVEDTTPLKKMELVYAFDFALKTKVFDNFTLKKDEKGQRISASDFFKVVISRYLRKTKEAVTNLLDKSETLNKVNLTDFYSVCGQNQYNLSIGLKDLTQKTLLGKIEEISKFHNGDMVYGLKNARNGILLEISFIQNLIDVYKKNYPESKENIDQETNLIKQNLATVYRNILAFEVNTSKCSYVLLKKENHQQNALIFKEIEYIKTVFDRMLKASENNSSERSNVEQTFASQVNTSNLKHILGRDPDPETEYFDKINNDYYYFSKLGLLGRLVNYLREINPNITINIPTSMQYNDLYQKDKENIIQSVYLPQNGSYEERLAEFTKNVLEKIFNGNSAMIRWLDQNSINLPDYFSNKLMLLTELLKGKEHHLYNINENFCLGNLASLPKEKCLSEVNITSEKIINETLKVAKHLSLTDEDIQILKLINSDRKYPSSLQEKLFFKSQSEPLTILEKIHEEIIDNNDLKNEAELFHKQIIQSKQNLLFMPGEYINETMANNYSPIVMDSFKLISDFNNQAIKIENAHTDNKEKAIEKYFYKVDLEGDDHLFISTRNDSGNIEYLNPDKILDAEKIMINFHRDTRNYFENKLGSNK